MATVVLALENLGFLPWQNRNEMVINNGIHGVQLYNNSLIIAIRTWDIYHGSGLVSFSSFIVES